MAWTNPKTWAATTLTSGDLNTHVRDNLDYLKENIGLEAAVELTIAVGVVTKTKAYHTITVEGGAGSGNDDLDQMLGGVEGDRVVLKATTSGGADTVTVKNAVGADLFILEGGLDFAMDHVDDRIEVMHDGTQWVELSRSDNS